MNGEKQGKKAKELSQLNGYLQARMDHFWHRKSIFF